MLTPLIGQIPAFLKADFILFFINALFYAILYIGQKKLLDIKTYPALSFINWSSSSE